jgi:beta-mannosidase
VDFGGHWRLLHYAAKRFFAPLLVSAEYNSNTNVVDVYLTSDINRSLAGVHLCCLASETGLAQAVLMTCLSTALHCLTYKLLLLRRRSHIA